MRIFYATDGRFVAGGQMVLLDHVLTLRRLGFDARLAVLRPDEPDFQPTFAPGREAPWQNGLAGLTADDFLVVGEMHGEAAKAAMACPAHRVVHNQGPYFSFRAFLDMDAIRGWGCRAMITVTHVGAGMIRRMGWDRPLHVVRPALDPVFGPPPAGAARALQVFALSRKRPQEMRLIRGILRSQRPDHNDVKWLAYLEAPRQAVAEAMAGNELFLALGRNEGLGLPPLEALASDALVVGYHGGGGREYATPDNGDWFDDGNHFEIAEALARLMDGLKAGERYEARRAAGRATAAAFSPQRFEQELKAAWDVILAAG